jgi:hypothetical protein
LVSNEVHRSESDEGLDGLGHIVDEGRRVDEMPAIGLSAETPNRFADVLNTQDRFSRREADLENGN